VPSVSFRAASDKRCSLSVSNAPVITKGEFMFRSKFFAAMISLVTTIAAAQPIATPTDLRKVTDQIMELVGAGNVEAGLKLLKPRTVIPEAEFDAMMGQAKLQLPMMTQRFGEHLGYEFLREDRVGEYLIRYTYIQRFDIHAMRWIFYTYRGKGGWFINTFKFDDKLPAIFQ
jgi:hypothetical protein